MSINTNVPASRQAFDAEKAAFAAYEAAYTKAASYEEAAYKTVGIDAHERAVMRAYEAHCDADEAKNAYDEASYAAYIADTAFRRG